MAWHSSATFSLVVWLGDCRQSLNGAKPGRLLQKRRMKIPKKELRKRRKRKKWRNQPVLVAGISQRGNFNSKIKEIHMSGYVYNWGDADITNAMTAVKCSGMISKPGEDGYGGTNWCFGVTDGAGKQWHVHLSGGKDGRKVAVLRIKASSTDNQGSNVIKFLDQGGGEPINKTNLKGLERACGSDFPQHAKLLGALATALDVYVLANP
jgi:hypothetical protein